MGKRVSSKKMEDKLVISRDDIKDPKRSQNSDLDLLDSAIIRLWLEGRLFSYHKEDIKIEIKFIKIKQK